MKLTFEQHLRNTHEILQAVHTLYPDKSLKKAKKEKGKDTKN
jgi:hypothetical protein